MEIKSQLMNIEIGRISPSPRNPRKTFNEADLQELASNIKNQGLLQPITVRPIDWEDDVQNGEVISYPTKYEIVCGERRYRAVKQNADGNDEAMIACIVKEMTDDEAFDAMITENLQRKDVDPIEESFAFTALFNSGKSIDEISARFGKPRRFIQERIRLSALINPLKELTSNGNIPITGAYLLARLTEKLQNSYYEGLQKRFSDPNNASVDVKEINQWITREFMHINNAVFLDFDEDETVPPEEEWNTSYEKCATCCMNTGNANCLFYSMKDDNQCTDRDCYERKTAAYYMHQIEEYGDRITLADQTPHSGNVVIVDDGLLQCGYDNVRRIRSTLIGMIKEKGYMIATSGIFDGQCKYYGEDERITKLLEENKVIECITLGNQWRLDVETCYFYVKGAKEDEPKDDPEEQEARGLSRQYQEVLDKVNSKADEELRGWASEKEYTKRTGKLHDKEEVAFWSAIIQMSDCDFRQKEIGDFYPGHKEIFAYVENNMTDDKLCMWKRAFLNSYIREKAKYDRMARRIMRECFKIAYPKEFDELCSKYAKKADSQTDKIKQRLDEIGYTTLGEKIK